MPESRELGNVFFVLFDFFFAIAATAFFVALSLSINAVRIVEAEPVSYLCSLLFVETTERKNS
jgi:hypothetical protein